MKDITIYNSGAPFTVLSVLAESTVDKKTGNVIPMKFGDKIVVNTGATVMDELTANYVCKVYSSRCTIAAVAATGASENKKIQELTESLKTVGDEKTALETRVSELSKALLTAAESVADETKKAEFIKLAKGEEVK